MEGKEEGGHDGSSIKPVSSLRSKFENMIQAKATANDKQPPIIPARPARKDNVFVPRLADDGPSAALAQNAGRASSDMPRLIGQPSPAPIAAFSTSTTIRNDSRPTTPSVRTRPVSMLSFSPTSRSPPLVTVDSPHSPPKIDLLNINDAQSAPSYSRPQSPTTPATRGFKTMAKTDTPTMDSSPVPILPPINTSITNADPRKTSNRPSPTRSIAGSNPPPINRAGKPKPTPSNAPSITSNRLSPELLAAPAPDSAFDEDKISPFSTPPSEPESPPPNMPPPIPDHSKPKQTSESSVRDNYFSRGPTRTVEQSQPPIEEKPPPMPPRTSVSVERPQIPARDRIVAPPVLPPRRDARLPPPPPPQGRHRSPKPPFPPPEPPMRRSNEYRAHNARQFDSGRPSLDNDVITRARNTDIRGPLSTGRMPSEPLEASRFPPPPSRPKTAVENDASVSRNNADARIPAYRDRRTVPDSDEEEEEHSPERTAPLLTDFPDASQANRRPPTFKRGPTEILTKYETKLFAICGEYACTSGYITRAWNIVTGEQLFSITHGEHVKATAITFKHSPNAEEEGRRLWIGTNTGELLEVDIVSHEFISRRTDAHTKTPVTLIHRHVSDMWTIDEEGKLMVWTAGEDGPNLESAPQMYRLPPKASYILIVDNQIWVAVGKGIWVYQHEPGQRTAKQLTMQPLVQPGIGDVTCGTTVAGQSDRVFFGHNDGKVTIYSRNTRAFLGTVQIRDYKISALVGVGSHLWAGFNTGMIYVYDMTNSPWKVLKDWKAHEGTIASVQLDATSIWKLDRLQVASLGTDSVLKLWDGTLKDDWLEADMQKNDDYFCTFKEVSASVLTWNAGASKPTHLWADERDKNFFRDYFASSEPSDIYVFGFQELVDLEDAGSTRRDVTSQVMKKMFKRDKKKEGGQSDDQERMRHQYRDWKDHLARMIDENMPGGVTYQLLHTSNLVGLFTCIFVKDSVRDRINHLDGAQIRLGMGGRLGNKGALVVRFLFDDSSVCLLNCHLAAGQSHTRQRNENVASMMEAVPLPGQSDAAVRAASFVGGGDGSMILDHEICILNGDLNYRIDSTPRDGVIAEIKRNQISRLLERDQLLMSRRKNPGFRLRAFEERPITFAPTYKYDVGTDTYDTSEKQRSPAWCDRVLYRGLGRIVMDEYRRWEVRTSDHRPVSGRFRLRVKTVKPLEREQMRLDCEQRFVAVKEAIAKDIKLDYLIHVLGMTEKEAARRLVKG